MLRSRRCMSSGRGSRWLAPSPHGATPHRSNASSSNSRRKPSPRLSSPLRPLPSKHHRISLTSSLTSAPTLTSSAVRVLAHPRQPKAGKTTTSRGDTPEKMGAFGSSSPFTDDLSKPVRQWHLITRVNAKTVEFLNVYVEKVLKGDGTVLPVKTYALRKTEIYGMGRCITAAQVAADHPELLADWAKAQEIQARKAERQKAQLGLAVAS